MDERNRIDGSQRMDTLDMDGRWIYPSAAETGHTEVWLPTLPGSPTTVERMLTKDFGAVVMGHIENAFNRQGYLRSGPQQTGPQVLKHYVAVAKGASLMDSAALGRMELLASEFEAEPEQREYFAMVVRPYLLSLSPKRR